MQNKDKFNWKSLYQDPKTFILLVVTIALVVVSVFLYSTRPTKLDELNISYLETMDKKVIKKSVETQFKHSFELKDYTFYGEKFKVFGDPYSTKADCLQGNNIVLHNVETEQDYNFVLNDRAESGVDLNDLDDGLYEIYVYDHYIKKRAYFSSPIEADTFSTIRRNDEVKTIDFQADKDLLKKFDLKMDKNYAFLTVKTNIPRVKTIDVLIDPCGNAYNDKSHVVDLGVGNDRIMEKDASMYLAKKLKKELEKYGLRVELTRNEESTPGYYGESGRAGMGYEKGAKVFVSLGMIVDENVNRPMMLVSPYTYGLLANEVAYRFQKTNLELYGKGYPGFLLPGVQFDSFRLDDNNEYSKFEVYPQLRETGGKATFAGEADFAKGNSQFRNKAGMESVYFLFANLDNNDSIEYYFEHREDMAKEIANAIAKYYEIEGDQSEVTN